MCKLYTASICIGVWLIWLSICFFYLYQVNRHHFSSLFSAVIMAFPYDRASFHSSCIPVQLILSKVYLLFSHRVFCCMVMTNVCVSEMNLVFCVRQLLRRLTRIIVHCCCAAVSELPMSASAYLFHYISKKANILIALVTSTKIENSFLELWEA